MSRVMYDQWVEPYLYKATDRGWGVVVSQATPPLQARDFLPDLDGVDAILANGMDVVNAEVIAAAGSLKVVSRTGVGYDMVDVEAAAKRGIAVTVTPGCNGETVADFALALMLALARRVPENDAALKSGHWTPHRGVDFFGKTLGIVGLGRIGRAVAKRAAGFDMKLLGYDPLIPPESVADLGVQMMELDELLANSDFVTLHAPSSAETVGMIGARELALMRPSAYVVNTARGALIDEEALCSALKEGQIAR